MKKNLLLLVIMFSLLMGCAKGTEEEQKLLVFIKTAAFVHESIPDGVKAVKELGLRNNFRVDTTSNSENINSEFLEKYAAVLFLNTTGDIFNSKQEEAFEKYIQDGGGFVGVHSATDTEYDWEWYGKLVGAYFKNHPKVQEASYIIIDKSIAATNFFKEEIWVRTDEIYNLRNINPNVKTLITVDEKTYEGGENGDIHPMSWYHDYDGGRAFYTAMGHTKESFSEEILLQHLLGGIKYAMGEN